MDEGEVGHAVLQVAHVTKEVLGCFGGWSDGLWRGYGRALVTVVRRCGGCRGRWRGRRMARLEGWNHDEEEKNHKREDDEKVWIEAYERVYA